MSGIPASARAAAVGTPLRQEPLPFTPGALGPAIGERALRLHHGEHHRAHLEALRRLLAKAAVSPSASVEWVVSHLGTFPSELRAEVRHHAGGHLNHSLFWETLSPPGTVAFAPRSPLGREIRRTWWSEERFLEALRQAGVGLFGSGWVWLCARPDGSLYLTTTANEDNPLMPQAGEEVGFPVLGLDVWEHAYYLDHQSGRATYLEQLSRCLDWRAAERRFAARSFASEAD
ncbi:MAG: superoxide dismutase [Opitutales bacterium]